MTGDITVNGETMSNAFFLDNAAYVPQEDRLWSALTGGDDDDASTAPGVFENNTDWLFVPPWSVRRSSSCPETRCIIRRKDVSTFGVVAQTGGPECNKLSSLRHTKPTTKLFFLNHVMFPPRAHMYEVFTTRERRCAKNSLLRV